MTAASKGECFRALLLRVAFSSLLLFSPAEAQLSPELSEWDHYPELPWWPEFAHMVRGRAGEADDKKSLA